MRMQGTEPVTDAEMARRHRSPVVTVGLALGLSVAGSTTLAQAAYAAGIRDGVATAPAAVGAHGSPTPMPGMPDAPSGGFAFPAAAAEADRPVGVVLGVFGGATGLVLLGAGTLRHKDRAARRVLKSERVGTRTQP